MINLPEWLHPKYIQLIRVERDLKAINDSGFGMPMCAYTAVVGALCGLVSLTVGKYDSLFIGGIGAGIAIVSALRWLTLRSAYSRLAMRSFELRDSFRKSGYHVETDGSVQKIARPSLEAISA